MDERRKEREARGDNDNKKKTQILVSLIFPRAQL